MHIKTVALNALRHISAHIDSTSNRRLDRRIEERRMELEKTKAARASTKI